MSNIIFINTNPSQRLIYKNILFFSPVLSLAVIAARPKENSHKINLTDLSFRKIISFFALSFIKKCLQYCLFYRHITDIFTGYLPFKIKKNKQRHNLLFDVAIISLALFFRKL